TLRCSHSEQVHYPVRQTLEIYTTMSQFTECPTFAGVDRARPKCMRMCNLAVLRGARSRLMAITNTIPPQRIARLTSLCAVLTAVETRVGTMKPSRRCGAPRCRDATRRSC